MATAQGDERRAKQSGPLRLARLVIGCVIAASVFAACSSDTGTTSPETVATTPTTAASTAAPMTIAPSTSAPATTAVSTTTSSTTAAPAPTTTTTLPREPVTVTGPITGGAGQANAAMVDLASAGYVEEEYFIEGDATSYSAVGELAADGKWSVEPADTQPFRTRIIVRRPVAAAFSGTVLVEWLNVSSGSDADPDWNYTSQEIIRSGDAWVGVSAQRVGVAGGGPIIGDAIAGAGGGLSGADPERYGTLVHPGDAFSFDIFSQAATALTAPDGPSPLGDLRPDHVIAIGESQSAFYLTTYIDAIQPVDGIFDGFLVHSRGGGAPTLDSFGGVASSAADAKQIRDDLDVPVLVFLTETDLTVLGYGYVDQPDSSNVVIWQTAGTAHADSYLLTDVYHLDPNSDLAAIVNCAAPLNSGPQHEVLQAALHHLVEWVVDGTKPPLATRIQLSSVDPPVIARDDRGNAIGGIRTGPVEAPIAALSGDPVPGAAGFCSLFGSTTPFDAATVAGLYPTADDYLAEFRAATARAVAQGFVLAVDGKTMDASAAVTAASLP